MDTVSSNSSFIGGGKDVSEQAARYIASPRHPIPTLYPSIATVVACRCQQKINEIAKRKARKRCNAGRGGRARPCSWLSSTTS